VADCALRELLEETGVEGKSPRLVAVTDPLQEAGYHMQLAFEVATWSGEPRVMDPAECQAVSFFPPGNLPDLIFPPSQQVLDRIGTGCIY
jgi:ADP-ribose pyrophosphatase YjhB (NUDIX family)